MKLNAIIIDDEKDACENINHLIATYFQSYFNQIFIVHSTKEAEAVIDNHPIDLFFIDIEMPSESGIDFAARRSDKIKNFIFITAYDQYAINAFRLHAFDYILKPIDENLFSSSVSRLLNQSSITPINDILHFAQQVQSKTKIDTLTLRDKNSIEIVAIKDIIYIEAERAYSKIVYELKDKKIKTYLASHNLSYYEEILEDFNFIRVHKSFLVSKSHIEKYSFESMLLQCTSNIQIPVSRRKQTQLSTWL